MWAPDGAAIYYLSGGGVLRAPVTPDGAREPRTFFVGNWINTSNNTPMTNWDVHPDGTSFVLVRTEAGDTGPGPPIMPIEIVVNWFEELRQRVPN